MKTNDHVISLFRNLSLRWKKKLSEIGFKFEIKGRTKSIHSIYTKIKKAKIRYLKISTTYLLSESFLMCQLKRKKLHVGRLIQLWLICTSPIPNVCVTGSLFKDERLWKSSHNSIGTRGRWVEVQIRTIRMDEVAEKGLAAHWKYKGIKKWIGHGWVVEKYIVKYWRTGTKRCWLYGRIQNWICMIKKCLFLPQIGDLHKITKRCNSPWFRFFNSFSTGNQKLRRCQGEWQKWPLNMSFEKRRSVGVLTSPPRNPVRQWLHMLSSSKAKDIRQGTLKEVEFKDVKWDVKPLYVGSKTGKLNSDDEKKYRAGQRKKVLLLVSWWFYQEIAHEKLDMSISVVRDAYLIWQAYIYRIFGTKERRYIFQRCYNPWIQQGKKRCWLSGRI